MMSIGSTVVEWSIAGAFGTLVMDLFGSIARRAKLTHGVPPALVGKWLTGALVGRVFVEDIRTYPSDAGPPALMMAIHYLIGIALALFLGIGARMLGHGSVPPSVAFFYGIGTTVAAAFFMFPAMGFGFLGHKAPPEWMLFRSALVNHTFYGLGLALAAQIIGA